MVRAALCNICCWYSYNGCGGIQRSELLASARLVSGRRPSPGHYTSCIRVLLLTSAKVGNVSTRVFRFVSRIYKVTQTLNDLQSAALMFSVLGMFCWGNSLKNAWIKHSKAVMLWTVLTHSHGCVSHPSFTHDVADTICTITPY